MSQLFQKRMMNNEGFVATKVIDFNGTAGRGAQGATTLFTVTGAAIVYLFAHCTEDLVGAGATIQAGVSDNTSGFMASATATNFDAGDIWLDTSASRLKTIGTTKIVGGGDDIILTIGTADITDGILEFICLWRPVSVATPGNVVAA